jgi:fructose-1,6-bisphosphatase/inositol monophosphatase family enzyme
VSNCDTLASALFVTSEVASFESSGRRAAFDRMQAATRLTRTWGDCYGYLLVATGRAEVMIDPIVAVWDIAPLPPILEEAGGAFTDWQGRSSIHSGEGIATSGMLLAEVLHVLAAR